MATKVVLTIEEIDQWIEECKLNLGHNLNQIAIYVLNKISTEKGAYCRAMTEASVIREYVEAKLTMGIKH